MLRFIIRLDDATPKMNRNGWEKIEGILDKYNVKPIVGIIPDNKDKLFIWPENQDFWAIAREWQKKGWTIAQHGYHHVYRECDNGVRSEFVGLSYTEQKNIIERGYRELLKQGIKPTCFFAPAHTFDSTTVEVCRDSGFFDFISDGYALYPYKENGMYFIPSIFDTAHKILPFGVYTFILHPSFTTEAEFEHFDNFIKRHRKYFLPIEDIISSINMDRRRNAIEMCIEPAIRFMRKLRKKIRG